MGFTNLPPGKQIASATNGYRNFKGRTFNSNDYVFQIASVSVLNLLSGPLGQRRQASNSNKPGTISKL